MKKIFAQLMAMIVAVFNGVHYVEMPEKPFTEGYYLGNQTDEPDYKQMYSLYNGCLYENLQECNKDPKKYASGFSPYQPQQDNNQYYWFWLVNEAQPNLLSSYTKLEDGSYLWEVPEGTQLISIGNGHLVSTTGNADTPYPEVGYSNGVFLSYVVRSATENIAYKITYGSMKRWWCCMDKETPDGGTEEEPKYGHTCTFSTTDKFYSGSVVGEAGCSGIGKDKRSSGKAYVIVAIEQCGITTDGSLDEVWKSCTVEELYERTNTKS